MRLRASFLDQAQTYLKAEDMRIIRDAYRLIQEEEESSCTRHPGETCAEHAKLVTMLLLPRRPDARTIVACLLQCIQKPELLRSIEERFGKSITGTIASLSVIDGGTGGAAVSRPPMQHILLVLSKDIRVLLIALHNRWHALRQTEYFDPKQRSLIAREALEIFAPLCARLGIYSLKYELETLAFHILFKEEANDLKEKLDALRKQYGPFLQESKRTVSRLLSQEGKHAMILTREKHPYSIFRKLQRKNLTSITDLHDLFGVRILVDTEEECYEVLGIIHRAYRPIPHRMKDYIAMGKPNGYRSIHTTVLGVNPEESSLPVEIQIRTHEMDEEAEYGIAAHWNYKEQGSATPFEGTAWQKRIEALSDGTVQEENTQDLAEEFSDRIFVLTPKGDVIELPKGAGPLDFAFRVHTNIGLRYRHAKVNGMIAPINQQLENGDHVQVTVWSEPKPSEQWMQIVRTKEARQKLRGFFHASAGSGTRPAGSGVLPPEKRMRRVPALPHASSPLTVSLESQTPLPHHFARCCRADLHSAQRPPIVGYITREGTVRIHWSGCRMITNANRERLIRAAWKAASPLSSAL